MTTSENIKQIRKSKKISQKKLAQMTGLSVSTIQGYEYGDFKPKYEAVQKIATALGVEVSDIDEGFKPASFDTPDDFEKKWADLGGGKHPDKNQIDSQLESIFLQLNDIGRNKIIEYGKDLLGNLEYRR